MSSVEVCFNALCDLLFFFYLAVATIENNLIAKRGT